MKSVLAALVASSLIVGCALPEEEITASDTGSGGGGGGGTTYQDTTAPAGLNFLIDGGSTTTSRTEVTLELDASDDVEVTEYYASESSEPPTAKTEGWSKFKRNVEFNLKKGGSLGIHPRTVHVWFKDAAGNISESLSASISLGVYDTTAPEAIGVAIDEGAESTLNSTVTLALEATDDDAVSSYFASESDVAPESQVDGWQDYESSVSYAFDNSSAGTKNVYVWFKDAAGNVSESVTDAIELRNRVVVSTGADHTCAVTEDQSVQCWGADGQIDVPEGLKATSLSAGIFHTCAVTEDQSVQCWGYDSSGQMDVPEGLKATSVGAGYQHTCAVTEDQSVQCWGYDNSGQMDVPEGLKATSVGAGFQHTCAVTEDQSVQCWGYGGNLLNVPEGLKATSLSVGIFHTCAVTEDQSVQCWGYDRSGRRGSDSSGPMDVPEGLKATSVGAGEQHTCATKEDQSVVCWGNSANNRLNVPKSLQ